MASVENLTRRLEGSIIVLEPLGEEHVEGLWEAAQAPEIWAWLAHLNERERFERWIELTLAAAREGSEGAVRNPQRAERGNRRQQSLSPRAPS